MKTRKSFLSIRSFKHLANWYPNLTLDETMKLALRKLHQEQQTYTDYSKLKVWQHPIDKKKTSIKFDCFLLSPHTNPKTP